MEEGREEGALLLLVLLLDVLLDKVVARGEKDDAPNTNSDIDGGNS